MAIFALHCVHLSCQSPKILAREAEFFISLYKIKKQFDMRRYCVRFRSIKGLKPGKTELKMDERQATVMTA